MKHNPFPKTALFLLVAGLLLSAGIPLTNRFLHLTDAYKGFLTGLGLALTCAALAMIDRHKKGETCKSLDQKAPLTRN